VSGSGHREFGSAPSLPSATLEGDIVAILGRLQEVGINQVVVVDLSSPDMPWAVARVVVPGLEGVHSSPSARPRRRVRADSR
jgi:ribosomal protein S12 methylthiotransferase accessory factor YcaO